MNHPPQRGPRVLFVTCVVPWNPRYGGALRCHGVLRGLAERSELHIAFAGSDPAACEAFATWPAPEGVARYVLTSDTRRASADDWQASRTLRAALGDARYRPSLRRLEETLQPEIVWYFEIEALRRAGFPARASAVLDHCDVRWRKQTRLAGFEKGRRQKALKLLKATALRFDDVQLALHVRHSVVASPAEIDLLWPARQVSEIPNGFDFPAAAPSPSPISHRLLFYGSLFYSPNTDGIRWMCREVWPLVKGRRPHAQLDVVGLGHEALADLADAPGVTFHGFVEDLDTPIRQAAALVVPLRVAGGTRIKILEAWAKGLPVISTTIGAEGLAACAGESVLLGDTAETFAGRCVDILDDIGLRRRLALAGYEHGRSKFDWSVVNRAIDRVLAESLQQTGQQPPRGISTCA